VDISANFGFVGVGLKGTAEVGAKLKLGFDTNAPELADNKLTLQEAVNAVKDGHALDLFAIPDLVPIPVTGKASAAGTSTSLTDASQQSASAKRVKVGDVIKNLTDGSSAMVQTITDTVLTTTALTGGSDNTWSLNDKYEIELRNFGVADLKLSLTAG